MHLKRSRACGAVPLYSTNSMPFARPHPAISGSRTTTYALPGSVRVRKARLTNNYIYFSELYGTAGKWVIYANGPTWSGGRSPPVTGLKSGLIRLLVGAGAGHVSSAECHPMDPRPSHPGSKPASGRRNAAETGHRLARQASAKTYEGKVDGVQPPERFSLPSSCPI